MMAQSQPVLEESKSKPVFWTGPGNRGMSGLIKETSKVSTGHRSSIPRDKSRSEMQKDKGESPTRRSTNVVLHDQQGTGKSLNLTRAATRGRLPAVRKDDTRIAKEFTFTGYDIMKDEAPKTGINSKTAGYQGFCDKYRTVPCRTILQSIHTDRVIVKSRPLGPSGTLALAGALLDNRSVKRLNIPDNFINNRGAEAVSQILSDNDVLSEICLADNHIGHEGLESLCSALKQNKTVRRVDLSGNHIGDREAAFVAELMEINIYIQFLNLRNNNIRELGGEIIGLALRSNDTLEELDLSWNHLRGRGAVSIATAMQTNNCLRILNVSWNGFSNNGCIAMANALLKNSSLEELDLTNNRVHPPGLMALARATLINGTLNTLKIGMNPITPVVALEMLRVYEKITDNSGLRHLQLKNITVDQEFERLLEEIQKTRIFKVEYGPVLRKGTDIEKVRDDLDIHKDPLQILFDFMKKDNLRVIDLFQRLDTDKSESVTRAEFKAGLLTARVPLTSAQLDQLVDKLDTDGDGEVDLKELITGEREYKRMERVRVKKRSRMRKITEAQNEPTVQSLKMEMMRRK